MNRLVATRKVDRSTCEQLIIRSDNANGEYGDTWHYSNMLGTKFYKWGQLVEVRKRDVNCGSLNLMQIWGDLDKSLFINHLFTYVCYFRSRKLLILNFSREGFVIIIF